MAHSADGGNSEPQDQNQDPELRNDAEDSDQRSGTDRNESSGTQKHEATNGQVPQDGAKGVLTRASTWTTSLVVAVGTYVSMLIASVVLGIIFVASIKSGMSDVPAEVGDYSQIFGDFSGVYSAVALIFQLVAMSMGGTLHWKLTDGTGYSSDSITISAHILPLVVTAVGAIVLFVASRLVTKWQLRNGHHITGVGIWLSALASAVMLVAVTVILTLALAGRGSIDVIMSPVKYHFTAMSPQVVLYPLIFGTLISVWGRRSASGSMPNRVSDVIHRFCPGVAVAANLTGAYAASVTALVAIVASVVVAVRESIGSGALALFYGWPGAVDLLAMGHISGVQSSWGTVGGSDHTTMYLWSDDFVDGLTAWPMLIWLVIVVGILLLSVAWFGRRPRTFSTSSWFVMPIVFLLLGFVILWMGTVGIGGAFSGESGSGTVRPAWWTPIVFLIWGFLVEALARYAGPGLSRVLPEKSRTWLMGTPALLALSGHPRASDGLIAGGSEGTSTVSEPDAPHDKTNRSASGGAAEQAQLREPKPLDPKTKKRIKVGAIVVGVIVLLLALALGGVKIANATINNPDKVVKEYFDAVKKGDVEKAVDTIDPNVKSDQRALLTKDVYDKADKKITDYDVEDVKISDDKETAVAKVSVTQDQKTSDVDVNLRKKGGSFGLVTWEIDKDQSGLYRTVEYKVPQGVDSVKVNGTDVKLPESATASPSPSSSSYGFYGSDDSSSAQTMTFTVLPGQYKFSAPEGGKYITYGSDQKVDSTIDGGSEEVSFEQKLTDQALADAVTRANAKLDECTQVKKFEVDACGFKTYSSTDDDKDPQWSIKKYPDYGFSNTAGSIYSRSSSDLEEIDPSHDLYLGTTKSGDAKVDYQHKSYDDEWKSRDSTSSISGSFKINISANDMSIDDSHDFDGY
jgi:hypothetical protein